MNRAQQDDQPHRTGVQLAVRQALVAILAAFLAIGAISVLSPDDDAGNASIAPDTSLVVPDSVVTADDRTVVTVPLDTDVVDDQSTAVETSAPADTVTAPTATAPTVTGSTVTGSTATGITSGTESIVRPITIANPAVGLPAIDATAYAVYDATNDRWLAESGADTPMPVGSVMKLLTSYVVLQAGEPSKVVTVPALSMDIEESAIGLYQGEQLPRDVLLRAMLIVSANDAARSLAIDVGGSIDGFVVQMNAAAQALGMSNTVAANPIGLDATGAHSSAHDMISLAALLMQDQTFREAVAKSSANLHGQTFSATNKLLTSYEGATGVKTGHTTQAGYCLIGSASRDGRQLIVAVLGSQTDASRLQATTALLDWGFGQP